jgi:hypothetical protein
MTVTEYINELDPEKARKIEAHSGGHVKKDEEPPAAAEDPAESVPEPETDEQKS